MNGILKRPGTGQAKIGFLGGILLIALVIDLFPLIVMLSISVKGEGSVLRSIGDLIPRHITFSHYAEVVTSGRFGRYFFNSALVAMLVVGGVASRSLGCLCCL